MKMWLYFALLLTETTLVGVCRPAAAQVKVWQGTLALPTYEEGQPDPNPPFDIYQPTASTIPTR